MKIVWTVLFVSLVILVVGVLFVLSQLTTPAPVGDSTSTTLPDKAAGPPLRIGLIPERDIFLQRKRYRALAGYLSTRLDRPVRLVMMHTYATVLHDFAEKNVECAFLGSLATAQDPVLARQHNVEALSQAMAIIEWQLEVLGKQTGVDNQFEMRLRQIRESLTRMAGTVKSFKNIRRIVLTDYIAGVKMLDIDRSTALEQDEKLNHADSEQV